LSSVLVRPITAMSLGIERVSPGAKAATLFPESCQKTASRHRRGTCGNPLYYKDKMDFSDGPAKKT